jgi:hypothetical protein
LGQSATTPDEIAPPRAAPAAVPRAPRIARGIVLMLLFKAAVLAILYIAVFGPERRPVTPERLADVLLSAPAEPTENAHR